MVCPELADIRYITVLRKCDVRGVIDARLEAFEMRGDGFQRISDFNPLQIQNARRLEDDGYGEYGEKTLGVLLDSFKQTIRGRTDGRKSKPIEQQNIDRFKKRPRRVRRLLIPVTFPRRWPQLVLAKLHTATCRLKLALPGNSWRNGVGEITVTMSFILRIRCRVHPVALPDLKT
ncbi:hypothetical protein C8R44DRAFT_740869 [Mycena epipterygia]|nr:hypothetical protein C8R44DRAFT_740869 [Mycena epipterygia]